MKTRNTSREVYERIKSEGLLSRLRFEVYEVLFQHGPLTASETWDRHLPNRQRSSISARFSELEAMHVVVGTKERRCGYTNNNAIAWDVTANLPVPLAREKSLTKDQEIVILREEVERLNIQLLDCKCELALRLG